VILLDVMMPTIDGMGVAQRLKLFPQLASVPVIFLTARDSPMDRIRGIQLGARHYLTKPFKISDVAAKIRALIGE
jgi:DNA-binding response OmpR family regulator